jgi:hypothetical protein
MSRSFSPSKTGVKTPRLPHISPQKHAIFQKNLSKKHRSTIPKKFEKSLFKPLRRLRFAPETTAASIPGIQNSRGWQHMSQVSALPVRVRDR